MATRCRMCGVRWAQSLDKCDRCFNAAIGTRLVGKWTDSAISKPVVARSPRSWWVGLDRGSFTQQAQQERPRMQGTKFGRESTLTLEGE